MSNDARQSPLDHYHAHNACVQAWASSGYQDHSALNGAAPALEAWLNDYPAQAGQIQQLAICDCYTADAYQLHPIVEATARVGLDAALIRPEVTREDTLSLAVLGLALTKALLAQDKAGECQRMLDYASRKIASLEQAASVRSYLDLHLDLLTGVFAEATLEYGIAADHYRKSMGSGLPLLDDPAQKQELCRVWTPLLYGSGPDLIQGGAAKSAALLEHDIRSACHRAVMGYARTAEEGKEQAAQDAIRFVRRYGLPPGGNPLHLRRVLLCLPFAELQECLPDLLALADDFQRRCGSSAWKVLLHSTAAAHPEAPAESSKLSLNQAMRVIRQCQDALTMAVAAGDLMTSRLQGSRPLAGSESYRDVLVTIHRFVALVGSASRGLIGTTEYLPFKALLDAPVARAVEWLFNCLQEQLAGEGALLSNLLDALRTREQEVPPLEFEIGSVEQGLSAALNRLSRLGFAMTQARETVAIVLQTVGEDTLFFCATGNPAEQLIFARAGAAYQVAARQLTNSLRASLNLSNENCPARGLRPLEMIPAELPLAEAGKAAFNALPACVASLVASHRVLLWVPDFRSDQDGVPFELFHDGAAFLGLVKVMARALSLQELLWVVEPSVLPPHEPHRSFVVAAPRVPGFMELIYSEREACDIRSALVAAGLESPVIEESELDTATLLHACEKAGVVHIAAHGVTSADGEALVLPRGERLLAGDIERKPQFLRSFVFLNTCSLGQSRYLGGGISRGIAYALVRQHAPAVVANLLPVYDRSSARLSVEFYNEARTAAVGEALRRARATLAAQGVPPAHWGCTVLIGDPGHVLPATKVSPPATKRKRDRAARLLEAYMNPKKNEHERAAAFRAARSGLTARGAHLRLLASMNWVQGTNTLDPDQPADPAVIERLAALAHEIGHPAGEALMRFTLASQNPEGRGITERLADLDKAIRSLEPLAGYAELWSIMLNKCLAARQRLMVPQEPPVINLDGMHVNDQKDEIVRAVFNIQRSLDQEEIRRSRLTRLRLLEATLEDVAWNAVVIGQHNRFTAVEARLEFATMLTKKLCAKKLLAPAAEENAQRIIAGFLPYLWSVQRIIHLDRELAVGQTAALSLVLRSISANWTPPETSSAYTLIADLPARIDRVVQAREVVSQSKYARALLAISSDVATKDELSMLGPFLRGIIEGTPGLPPTAAADCAAWTLGLLLEKIQDMASGNDYQREAARELQHIFDGFNTYLEGWFMPYLMDGFSRLRSAPLNIMHLWP